MSLANKARRYLIYIGKVLPFIVCAIVLLSYLECITSYVASDYVLYDNYTTFNKPISRMIAEYFEYDLLTVVICLIIGISVETCHWNKLATCYLAVHLLFKHYIEGVEVEVCTAILICATNAIISLILVYKGIKQTKIC